MASERVSERVSESACACLEPDGADSKLKVPAKFAPRSGKNLHIEYGDSVVHTDVQEQKCMSGSVRFGSCVRDRRASERYLA